MGIQNNSLRIYLTLLLKKRVESIDEKDLEGIEYVMISNADEKGDRAESISELLLFPNVKKIEVLNSLLTEEDIHVLAQTGAQEIIFTKCFFEEDIFIRGLSNVPKLNFQECFQRDFAFLGTLPNLESLEVNHPYGNCEIPVTGIHSPKLSDLRIQSCSIDQETGLNALAPQLKTLSLAGVAIEDYSFLELLPGDATVYLSKDALNHPFVASQMGRLTIIGEFPTNTLPNISKSK